MSFTTKIRLILVVVVGATLLALRSVSDQRESGAEAQSPAVSFAASVPAGDAGHEQAIGFLQKRVQRDPEDYSSQNQLAGYYLLRARATGSPDDLALAFHAAHTSLRSVGAERNLGGLAVLAQTENAAHAFAEARDHARELARLNPSRSTSYQILGDALLEMGDYAGAADAFRQMARRSDGNNLETETRFARLAWLRGDAPTATRRLTTALALAHDLSPPPRETIAWCDWQLGDIAFGTGDYPLAERQYQNALAAFSDYAPALAAQSRVRAARGDLAGAIESAEHAVRLRPDSVPFVGILGDLYQLNRREKDAHTQYARVEQIERRIEGARMNRETALFYADHDRRAEEAYAAARREYGQRADIVGADILAWTALKAGKITEAQTAIQAALRLGTQDARIFYHAGRIAEAAGNTETARRSLRQALALSPQFDPLQAPIARTMLHGGVVR